MKPFRILNSSDWHVDVSTAGYRRWDDVTGAVRDTLDIAIDRKVDAYLFTGDYCDPDGGGDSFGYAHFMLDSAVYLADHGIKSYWMAGNHDVVESGNGFTTLSPLRALATSKKYIGIVHVFEEPCHYTLADGETDILFLPFTSHDRSYDPGKFVLDAARRMKERGEAPKACIVAGHLNIKGIEIGSETTDFPRGRDVFFPQDACEELAKMTEVLKVNGHYHRSQCFEGIHIPGAISRLTFGEESYAPGYNIIEI